MLCRRSLAAETRQQTENSEIRAQPHILLGPRLSLSLRRTAVWTSASVAKKVWGIKASVLRVRTHWERLRWLNYKNAQKQEHALSVATCSTNCEYTVLGRSHRAHIHERCLSSPLEPMEPSEPRPRRNPRIIDTFNIAGSQCALRTGHF